MASGRGGLAVGRRKDPEEHEAERRQILAVASEILQAEGPGALTNRRVAAAAGLTTMAIYSRLGSKGGILDALFAEGVETLRAAQDTVPVGGDPLAELYALVLVYRQTALRYAGHYRLLFGEPIPEYTPSEENRARLLTTYARLQQGVSRLVTPAAAAAITYEVFAACHGLVMLELAGMTLLAMDPEQLYLDVTRRLVRS
jgi:AcrR family transcriptional regulator